MTKVEYDKLLSAMVVTIDEKLSLELYKRTMETILSSPDFRPGMGVLYDIRSASGFSLSREEIGRVGEYARGLVPRRGKRWKVSILTGSPVMYGLARMFQIMHDDAPFEVSVFDKEEEARAWVRMVTK